MRIIISASLVLALVLSTSVGLALQRNGQRGSSGQQSRGFQNRRSNQQFQNRGYNQRSQNQAYSNQGMGQGRRGGQGQAAGAAFNGVMTVAGAQGLVYMRQEEKLARDVYLTLGEKWNLRIFANISKAESRHMAALGKLLANYNLPDPVVKDIRGQFPDKRFTELYRSLVASGLRSPTDALRVGVRIEELDIADLKTEMNAAQPADVRNVYEHLLRGSQQHLRAFTTQLR